MSKYLHNYELAQLKLNLCKNFTHFLYSVESLISAKSFSFIYSVYELQTIKCKYIKCIAIRHKYLKTRKPFIDSKIYKNI